MANSLLDFVMSLVRDSDAAARYAADPAAAIADANLPDVSSADVNQLIPVVAESLSSAVPATGGADSGFDANVWASGAATAAFDAFGDVGDQVPVVATEDLHSMAHGVIDTSAPAVLDTFDEIDVPTIIADAPVIDDTPLLDSAFHDSSLDDSSLDGGDTPTVQPDDQGFDIF